MNLALMVKRVEMKRESEGKVLATYKGDAVINLSFATTGLIVGWGDGDSFEIDYADFQMLQDLVRNVSMKMEKERYLQNQPKCLGPL